MAEIKLEEKRSSPLAWVIGLLVLVLVVWGAVELLDTGDDIDTVIAVEPAESARPAAMVEEPAPAPPIAVVTIVATPAAYVGRAVSGTATVADVISDRGFWIEQDGQRMFVIIDEPVPEVININPGQTVELTGSIYTNTEQLSEPIEDDARAAIQDQPAFLYVTAENVRITDRPAN